MISDEEFDRQYRAAKKRGETNPRKELRALKVGRDGSRLNVEIEAGWSIAFDPRIISELKNATEAELFDVKLLGAGYTLEWTQLDEHFRVGAILIELLGERFLRSEFGKS